MRRQGYRGTPSGGQRRCTGAFVAAAAAVCLLAGRSSGSWVSGWRQCPEVSRISIRSRQADAPDASPGRRDAAAVLAASLLVGSPATAKDVVQVPAPVPPKPSKNPAIYNLQVVGWKREPYGRMALYLQAVTQRFIQDMETSVFGGKSFIHWTTEPESDDFFKFDVVDRSNYNEAAKSGQILIDSDMSVPENGLEVYVYKDKEARDDLTKKILVEDLVIIPTELQEAVRVIQKTPFPPFVGGEETFTGLRVTVD
ncbi:unnamed protein product [Effrenium voratum]|uniref:Uncharacterized protein n=1 Tax=Effrenium voratum TaxID=2562239 RepID=A0AA36JB98_9DINO|nr:unnamed protein product [Effrenium voratum]